MTEKELRKLFENSPSISITGSIKGMYLKGFWKKTDIIVKYKGYYYNLSLGVEK